MNVKENAWNKGILVQRWAEIYEDYFDYEADFSEDLIPDWFDSSRHFAVLVARGLELYEVIAAIERECNFYFLENSSGNDIDILNGLEDSRETTDDYCVVFNKAYSAEKDRNLPDWDDTETIREKGITLIERLLLELFVCDNESVHLDRLAHHTICGGSIITDPDVISAYNEKFDEEYEVVPMVGYDRNDDTIYVKLMSLGTPYNVNNPFPSQGVRVVLFYRD